MLRHSHEDGPDEAAEFSGDGRDGHVTMFAPIKPEELVDQTELGLHGNGMSTNNSLIGGPCSGKASKEVN